MDGGKAGAVTTLEELQTPCLILDRGILERNLKRMSDAVRKHGVALRPHLKTAKSADVGRLATQGEAGGITVSTIAEAEYFSERGFRDILIGVAQPPLKLDRAAALIDDGAAVTLVTDNVTGASAIAAHPARFRVFIEIDSGDRRAGIDPSSDILMEIARALGDKLAGVLTHAGHSYDCRNVECVKDVAEQERVAVVTAAERLRAAGFVCDVVSVGSTPTMTHAERLDGVTEARPGVYMFHDLFQAEIESCTKEDIAVTVLASVIGVRKAENKFLVDAGALAMSKDRSTQSTEHDAGYGAVWDLECRPSYGDCVIERVSQEHGVASGARPGSTDAIRVGSKVRISPNHSCITAAGHDCYYVVDGGSEVVAVWDRINGW